MNDQPAPQAPQTVSTDPNKELVDAALSQASTTPTNVPSEQSPTSVTPPVSENTVTTPPVSVENTYSPTGIVTPETEEATITNAPVAEIPVNDSTSVTPDIAVDPVVSEPVQEAQANDPIAQAQTLGASSLEEKPPFTADPSATPVMQVPAQPEGLVAKFLHIFKK
ncbi:MAG: hypothetical protein JWP06_1 [Candidatus Saccharibacteria bacterium]|nr:hypothetical protein [Candidatus Saccharibacteria bacterium]